jgi:hypothetical protein
LAIFENREIEYFKHLFGLDANVAIVFVTREFVKEYYSIQFLHMFVE